MSDYKNIDIARIIVNQYQPRDQFDDQSLEQLAQSIKSNGLIQPITVRKVNRDFQLIAGERRLRACKMLGLTQIPAIIIKSDEQQSAQMALIENIQREDLSAIEEAKAYVQIMNLTGINQSQLAQKVGKSQSAVANKIRLLNLDSTVIEAINAKQISERHGRALLGLSSDNQIKALNMIIKKDLTVKQTEEYVESLQNAKPKTKMNCFGISSRLILNTFRQTYKEVKKTTSDVEYNESETDDSYVITITFKK